MQMPKSRAMKLLFVNFCAILLAVFIDPAVFAQSMARSPAPAPAATTDQSRFDTIIKKIDEQNAKIDMLSQQILKLEQQLASSRPGVMVGEGTPTASATSTTTPSAQPSPTPTPSGNSHVVARGETLTSIAKMHNVSVIELQKFNHIENDRKLQIGQTIMIPGPSSPAPSPSASGQ